MPDVAWKRERLSAESTLPPHDPGDFMLIPVLLLAFPAEIRNMIPGRIIEDGIPAALTGLLQHFLLFGNIPDSLRFAGEQFLQPGEQIAPSISLQLPLQSVAKANQFNVTVYTRQYTMKMQEGKAMKEKTNNT